MKPLVPLEVDLRDFPFLPLDAARLRDSDFAVESTGDEFRAALLLWCTSWHQQPAASLPDNERALAMFAGYGRDLKGWQKVAIGALRGFQRCDDGRLYHPVLAEKALDAWDGKLRNRHRRECERIKKAAQRAKTDPAYPSFEDWKVHVAATGDDRWPHGPAIVPEAPAGDIPPLSPGTAKGRNGDVPRESLPLKGTGERDRGEGQGKALEKPPSSLRSDSSSAAPTTGRSTPPDEVNDRKALRIAQITDDAIEAFNARLGKPNGNLPMVVPGVGAAKRRKHVARCLRVARDICGKLYGSTIITRQFWDEYFGSVDGDDFRSGRRQGGPAHQNWTPNFEYLTREQTMIDVFDRDVSAAA
jgi:hypothetical protein